jgi:hypothetical protein
LRRTGFCRGFGAFCLRRVRGITPRPPRLRTGWRARGLFLRCMPAAGRGITPRPPRLRTGWRARGLFLRCMPAAGAIMPPVRGLRGGEGGWGVTAGRGITPRPPRLRTGWRARGLFLRFMPAAGRGITPRPPRLRTGWRARGLVRALCLRRRYMPSCAGLRGAPGAGYRRLGTGVG